MDAITRDDVVVLGDKQVSCTVENYIVVMSVAAGEFYDLNRQASHIWEKLGTPQRVSVLCDDLCRQYDVTPERCELEVLDLLNRLREKGVVAVCV
jgi:hypothetical protein